MYYILIQTCIIAFIIEKIMIKRWGQSNRNNLSICIMYVLIGLSYSLYIKKIFGTQESLNYAYGFVIETMLSIDNLILVAIIFNKFSVKDIKAKKRILKIGLISAAIMRMLFIYIGTIAISNYSYVTKVLGVVVGIIGVKMLVARKNKQKDEKQDPILVNTNDFSKNNYHKNDNIDSKIDNSLGGRILRKFNIKNHNSQFLVKENGQYSITNLLAALIVIEIADLIFALDSIPAVLLLTNNPYVAYSSNIFAILGLRSFYVIIEQYLLKFLYLDKIMALLLIFISVKTFL